MKGTGRYIGAALALWTSLALGACGRGGDDGDWWRAVEKLPTSSYREPAAPVPGLDTRLPAAQQLALKRLNEYRLRAGLAPAAYDPQLSADAIRHARYVLTNCSAAAPREYRGNEETPGLPDYSPAGDRAARRSVIAYASADPLHALESLIANVYHRAALLRRGSLRVGIASSWDNYCGATLVVLETDRRPVTADAGTEPRFIPFPSKASDDFLPASAIEAPDPRPDRPRLSAAGALTIHLTPADARALTAARAVLTGPDGAPVPLRVTHPAQAAKPLMPAYRWEGAGIAAAMARNADLVMVLPEKELMPGTAYRLAAALVIGGETHELDWRFTTRAPRVWRVKPAAAHPAQRLEFALAAAGPGDTIELAAGRYDLAITGYPLPGARIRLRGVGADRTVLRSTRPALFAPQARGTMITLAAGNELVVQDLAWEGVNAFLLLAPESRALLRRVRIAPAAAAPAVQVGPGAELRLEEALFAGGGAPPYITAAPAAAGLRRYDRTRDYGAASVVLGRGNRLGADEAVVVKTLRDRGAAVTTVAGPLSF